MNEIVHTAWGPSSAARRIACPGSLQAEADFPDSDNVYAVIGSGAHALADTILRSADLKQDLAITAEDYIDQEMFVPTSKDCDLIDFENDQVRAVDNISGMADTVTDEIVIDSDTGPGYLVNVDSEMAHAVNEYIQRVKAYVMDKDYAGYHASEVTLDLSDWLPDQQGTADFVAIVGTTLHVDDLKYGKGVQVFAEKNEQGRNYALGVYSALAFLFEITRVVITIHQPRLNHVDSEELNIDELLSWADDTLVPAYKLSIQHDAPRIPGGKQCTFCKAKGNCAALAAEMEHQMQEAFPILDKTKNLDPHLVPLEMAKLAQTWSKAVEAYAIEQLEAGEQVFDGEEYYKLVNGKGSRAWQDETKARRKCAGMRLSRDEFMTEPKFKSPAQIEKLVGKPKFIEFFSPIVEKKEGKPTLAKMSDKRPAISSAEALGFDDVTTEEDDFLTI